MFSVVSDRVLVSLFAGRGGGEVSHVTTHGHVQTCSLGKAGFKLFASDAYSLGFAATCGQYLN